MKCVVVAALLAGCNVAPPHATAIDAERAQVDLAELHEGRSLLISKCGGSCHRVPLPSQHSATAWPAKLDEMSARAGLDGRQRGLIEKYLVTMSISPNPVR
jgi:hypothetical protein